MCSSVEDGKIIIKMQCVKILLKQTSDLKTNHLKTQKAYTCFSHIWQLTLTIFLYPHVAMIYSVLKNKSTKQNIQRRGLWCKKSNNLMFAYMKKSYWGKILRIQMLIFFILPSPIPPSQENDFHRFHRDIATRVLFSSQFGLEGETAKIKRLQKMVSLLVSAHFGIEFL